MQYELELLEEYGHVNFYTLRLEGETHTEAEKFLLKFPKGCPYDDEVDRILAWLDTIAERGALERYFRPEGRYGDGVGVIPIDVGNRVRLYCLRLSDRVLVIGNGGVKDAGRWQDSRTLEPHVRLLVDTSRFIHARLQAGTLGFGNDGKTLTGNLKFTQHEKEQTI